MKTSEIRMALRAQRFYAQQVNTLGNPDHGYAVAYGEFINKRYSPCSVLVMDGRIVASINSVHDWGALPSLLDKLRAYQCHILS